MANVLATLSQHRVASYVVVSASLLAGTVARAVERNSNFYSIAVDLSRNSSSVLVLANFGVVLSLLLGRIFQQIFFGSLRASELERLYDRVWFFLTESLLAWTIFRDELDTSFGILFGLLLFAKCFHWLLQDRIEWMDQVPHPGPNWVFHVRANALFLVLWLIDITMLALAIESVVFQMSGIILFASEYAILLATLFNCIHKYIIVCYDIRRASRMGGDTAPPWEDKSMYMFYVDLLTDFLKLITYLVFFVTVLTNYGLPLNIVRDVFMTARSFYGRVRDLMRYRAATRNMDQRYPDASVEELNAMSDRTCIICREEMINKSAQAAQANGTQPPAAAAPPPAGDPAAAPAQAPAVAPALAPAPASGATTSAPVRTGPNDTPKKLPCGHIFHFHCLRSWLERQQSCPTCRRTVLEENRPTNAPVPAPVPAPGAGGAGAVAPAAPQPGQVPQPPQGQQPAARAGGAAAAVGAHIQNMNAQLAQLHNLNQNIADTLQRLQRQHNNNLVPNQLQYQPPVGGAWPAPPAAAPAAVPAPAPAPAPANGHAGQQQQPTNLVEMQERMAARIAEYRRMRQLAQPAAQEPAAAVPAAPQPGSTAEPPVIPAQTADASTSSSTPAAAATQSTEQRPAASPTTETPATPSPAQARPAQAPDTAARTAAYEAAQRRLAALRGAQFPSPATIVPRPVSAGSPTHNVDAPIGTPSIPTPTIPAETAPTAGPSSVTGPAPATRTATAGTAETPPTGVRVARGPQFGLPPTKSSPYGVPGAIPLYDPSHAHVPGYPMLSFQQAVSTSYVGVPQANFVRAPFPTPRTFANESATPRGPPLMQGLAGSSPFGLDGQRGRPATPLSELPSRLSPDQLATLDHTTREAIDERLRMLDGVQATLQRCTDELLRVRSVLPPPTTRAAAPTRTPEPSSTSATRPNISEFARAIATAIGADAPTSDSLLQEVTQLLERQAAGALDQAQRERVQNALQLLQMAQSVRAPVATANETPPSGYVVLDHAAAASSSSGDETPTPEPDAPSS